MSSFAMRHGGVRIAKLRATTAEWSTAYPWHYGPRIPRLGPVVGVDLLGDRSPFGLDPFAWVNEGLAQNPNVVVCGAPANGKSAFVKQLIWWLAGVAGHRFVATDVKGEYRLLARALGVPVVDLRPGGSLAVNPLDDPAGRPELVAALAAVVVDRPLDAVERATLAVACRLLPARPRLSDLVGILREVPDALCTELVIDRAGVLDATREVRFGLGELLAGHAGALFDSPTNAAASGSARGIVVDVSGCGTDDRALRLALLAGGRAADRLVGPTSGRTVLVNDEAWRLTSNLDTVRWLQHSFKLGRQQGLANVLVVHRFGELGAQADGAAGQIGARLVADADTRIMFRHGDLADARDTTDRLGLPAELVEVLATMPPHRCLVQVRDRLALVDVVLSPRMRAVADTNAAMRAEPVPAPAPWPAPTSPVRAGHHPGLVVPATG